MSSLEMSIADYQRIVMGNPLDDRFMRSLAVIGQSCHRMKWYTTCMVALAAMSIGDQVRPFYKRLLANFIPEKARFSETGKLREALLKTTGIIGTAKVCFSSCFSLFFSLFFFACLYAPHGTSINYTTRLYRENKV